MTNKKEVDFGIMENAEINELETLSEKVPAAGNEEKTRILEMSRRKYNMRKNDIAAADEESVSGSEPYRPRTLRKVIFSAAACTILVGGIAGGVYLMKNKHTFKTDSSGSAVTEPATEPTTEAADPSADKAYSADEVDLDEYDMSSEKAVIGRMLNDFHFMDKISGEVIGSDCITSFWFDLANDTGLWSAESVSIDVISNDIMEENWYRIGDPVLTSNGYRMNYNYFFEGRTMYMNTDGALFGEEFRGNPNFPKYCDLKNDRKSFFLDADDYITYNRDKTALSYADFYEKYEDTKQYYTFDGSIDLTSSSSCAYTASPISTLAKLNTIDISSVEIEYGKKYMDRECLLLKADMMTINGIPTGFTDGSYSENSGFPIAENVSKIKYAEMLVDKETGTIMKQLFKNENGEAIYGTGYSKVAFNENAEPLPDIAMNHPY
ncbi:hypothetical protein [Ruminococcus flavefaciens]|uniref:hypothetical protein n=1 Tax=Ruminococcus flavefaciens TaxID=1265 RepID=UPI0026EFA4F3|nr:hypothetical protein [Ruminococcus flavefaciens]